MKFINKIFSITDVKSITVIKNAFYSFFIKGLNIGVNFLTIPLVLTFLNTTQYGVWLTLTAILGWFTLFDLGFGNGLRNHLTIAITNNDDKEGKIYVSTTYAALSVIFGSLIVIFLLIHPFINWTTIFNAPLSMAKDINTAVLFAMVFLFVQFIVRLINTILLSFQRAAMADLSNTIVQVFILAGLFVLKTLHRNSLTDVAIVYSLTPVIVFFSISAFFFLKTYPAIRPSIKFVKVSYVNKLLKIGLNYFVIQIAALVLYASDNFIITQFFNPSQVTTYNIAYKYFSISNILFSIILAPFWSMTTQAVIEGDYPWIKKSINKLIMLWLVCGVCEVIQIFASKSLYKVWTHNLVTIPFELSVVMAIYFFTVNWGTVFGTFLNGVSKIKLQLYFSIVGMIINVPVAIIFIKLFHLSIIGVPLATIFTMLGGNILATIQYNKIVNRRASGVWNK